MSSLAELLMGASIANSRQDHDDHETSILPDAQIAELQEIAQHYGKADRFKVGDVITPRGLLR